METITLEPKTKKELEAVKAIANRLNITVSTDTDAPIEYDPEFTKKIKQSVEDAKAGKFRFVTEKDFIV
jgi:hypothetical protein